MALLLAACAVTVLPSVVRLAVPHGPPALRLRSERPTPRMQLLWGQEPETVSRAASGAPSLMELSVSYAWCLSDVELVEMESYQASSAHCSAVIGRG